jgi:hypothetical protein
LEPGAAGHGWLALDHDLDVDANTYNLTADMLSAGATLDLHPFGNGFRLSAGARYHNVDVSGKGAFTGATVEINGTIYNVAAIGAVTTGTAPTAPTLAADNELQGRLERCSAPRPCPGTDAAGRSRGKFNAKVRCSCACRLGAERDQLTGLVPGIIDPRNGP